MSFVDKMRGKSQVGMGRARQWAGRATGSRGSQPSGLANQIMGQGRQWAGRARQWAGRAASTSRPQARGLTDQIMSRARQLAGRLKDAGKDIRRNVSR
jgi:uncharacterized protein YjbJ (UPF0337 family)